MTEPYVGEIRMVGFDFAPAGWALCDGQLLAIAENDILFSLIGTTYGGDGQSTYGVPDLRGRRVIHQNGVYVIGAVGGVEAVTLTPEEMPQHTHDGIRAPQVGNRNSPKASYWATTSDGSKPYSTQPGNKPMHPHAVLDTGDGQPHENMPPYQVISFIIALSGLYPSPN